MSWIAQKRWYARGGLGLSAIALLFAGCRPATSKSSGHSEKAATVERLPVETELTTVTLAAEAERRLGIVTVALQQEKTSRRRTMGGQVMIPSGRSIIVASPVAGVVMKAESRDLPVTGERVDPAVPLLAIQPLLSVERDVPTPAEQVQIVGAKANLVASLTVATGDVQRGKEEVKAAQIAFDRAQQLFADRAGARRAVDDTEAQLKIAETNLTAAQQREQQLTELLSWLETPNQDGEASVLTMRSPIAGVLNRIEVREEQTIASGATLFEVLNLDLLWIRVPVFVDMLSQIDREQQVHLVSLSGGLLTHDMVASPISAPPTADAVNASIDLYYQVNNTPLQLHPGQRIGVALPLRYDAESLVIPAASILYDIYGNTWVYERTGERQFMRRRVDVAFVDQGRAVLKAGPPVGTPIVTEGAAELFGTEFGAGK